VSARRWVTDLRIGARLALGGGRSATVRLLLTAVGVGLGVAVLLVAASASAMVTAHSTRTDARVPFGSDSRPAGSRESVVPYQTEFRDTTVSGYLVRAFGADAPTPPGVRAVPGPGEMVVSPALRDLLRSDSGALLVPRLPYRIVGTIDDAGLAGPGELYVYVGVAHQPQQPEYVRHWGSASPPEQQDPVLVVLLVTGVTVLLVPVAVFIAVAVRFGSAARDRQQAALRLVGADRRMTRRIASTEALAGSILGLALGALFFLAGRQLVRFVSFDEVAVFPTDVRPAPALAVLIAVLLPLAAVLVTMASLRGVIAEPLGVVRRSATRRRRLWWRVLPALGVVALLNSRNIGEGVSTYLLAAGIALMLGSVALVLPWAVEAAVRRLRGGGGLSWQLGVRRLALDSGTAARVVSGVAVAVAVAVAGAIAVQALFTGVSQQYTTETGADLARGPLLMVNATGTPTVAQRQRLVRDVRAVPGVSAVLGMATGTIEQPGTRTVWTVEVADCATVRAVAAVRDCTDGDAFLVAPGPALAPGTVVRPESAPGSWRVPRDARSVGTRRDPTGQTFRGLLLTPRAATGLGPMSTGLYVRSGHGADTPDRVRDAVARDNPFAQVATVSAVTVNHRYDSIRHGITVGAIAVLLLIGASLLVTMLEQLRDRRRSLAVLTAFGVRRRTLAASILWQTAIPMALGLALALAAGLALGTALLRLANTAPRVDWTDVATMLGGGAAVVLLVTLLALPALSRLMRPEGIRTE
jgi:FtsX-like permease family protein